jgi:hypothetical protein
MNVGLQMQLIETFYYPLGDKIKKRGADATKGSAVKAVAKLATSCHDDK